MVGGKGRGGPEPVPSPPITPSARRMNFSPSERPVGVLPSVPHRPPIGRRQGAGDGRDGVARGTEERDDREETDREGTDPGARRGRGGRRGGPGDDDGGRPRRRGVG